MQIPSAPFSPSHLQCEMSVSQLRIIVIVSLAPYGGMSSLSDALMRNKSSLHEAPHPQPSMMPTSSSSPPCVASSHILPVSHSGSDGQIVKGCHLVLGSPFWIIRSGRGLLLSSLWKGPRNGEEPMKASSNLPTSVLRGSSSRPNQAPTNWRPSWLLDCSPVMPLPDSPPTETRPQ